MVVTHLLPAPASRVLYAQWLPNCTPEQVALNADAHGLLSNVTPALLRVHGTPEPVDLAWLAALETDWQAPWSPTLGIQPAPGALGLAVARLEVVVTGDGWLRWLRIGSPAIAPEHEGRRFVQVFANLDRGADGQPHYEAAGEGVWRLSTWRDARLKE